MKTTFKNQNYFEGFINGVIAMYKLGENLDNNLNMSWKIEFTDNEKAYIHCEYSTYIRDILLNPGDEDFAPEYKHVDNRETITTTITDIENTEHIAMQIIEILDELSLVKDID